MKRLSKPIKAQIPLIQRYFRNQPVLKAWLFGSCSRGEENQMSDVDLLLDYDHSNGLVSLFKIGGMSEDLSEILGRKVDMVDVRGLATYAKENVEQDKILIYERN